MWKSVSIVHVKGPLFTTFKNLALLRPTAEPIFWPGSPGGRFPSETFGDALPIFKAHAAERSFFGVTAPDSFITAYFTASTPLMHGFFRAVLPARRIVRTAPGGISLRRRMPMHAYFTKRTLLNAASLA